MKLATLKLLSILAVVAAPTAAFADYVCGVSAFPGNTSLPYRLRVTFSTSGSCTGTMSTLWFCEKGVGATTSGCVGDSLRFGKPELAELFGQLARAADSQQVVYPSTSVCADASHGCGYTVDFRY
jgi:hypothetical protein